MVSTAVENKVVLRTLKEPIDLAYKNVESVTDAISRGERFSAHEATVLMAALDELRVAQKLLKED